MKSKSTRDLTVSIWEEFEMKYCEICGQVTNCTEDCKECLNEEKEFYDDLLLEQQEQM